MTDFQWLYLVLFLCYLMECVVLVEGQPVLFTRLCLHWRVFRFPGISMGKGRRLLLLNPLPWLADWHIAPQDVYTLTDKGVVTVNSLSVLPEVEKPVLMDSGDPRAAAFMQCLAGRGNDTAWTDPAPARVSLTRVRTLLVLLKLFCAAQFILVFLGAPFLVAVFSIPRMALPFLALVYAFSFCIALCWLWGRHRAGRSGGVRLLKAAWMVVYPLAAMRAVQSLCQGLIPPCHESALALALMKESREGRQYLSQILTRLQNLIWSRSLSPEASLALFRANASLAEAICVHWQCDRLETLFPTPDPAAACQCPVCGVAMRTVETFCPFCPEVRTVPCKHNNKDL